MRKKTVGDHIESMISGSFDNLNTLAIAKIVEIDNSNMSCSIQMLDIPELFGTRDEVEVIENVPIAPIFWGSKCKINAPLSVNDKVLVAFCQHDTFNARNASEPCEPNSSAKFDINNAIVVGQITSDAEKNVSNDFYIAYGGTLVTINDSGVSIKGGSINISGAVKIEGDLEVSGDATIGGKSFLTHTNGGMPLD